VAETEQDRSESPTTFKLKRAREKGTVARGMDLGFLTGLVAFIGFAWVGGHDLGARISEAVRGVLVSGPSLADGNYSVLAVIPPLFASAAPRIALMCGGIFLVVLLFEALQTGVVFSSQPLKPDFTRLNPVTGLKRLFTLRLLIETAKNVIKLVAYATVAWLVIRNTLESDVGLIRDAPTLLAAMGRVGFRLLVAFALVAMVVAVLDQMIIRRDFLKKMRMSRREVRREHREREGDPRLKQKRKELHSEFVKLSQSLRGLRAADVIITNPEHIALALRYDQRAMKAPMVVSLGTNRVAQRLKALAFIYGIPAIENRTLARALLHRAVLNQEIPEEYFKAVADIYNTLRKKARREGEVNA
jgi:flagellar biosynthetic protein FlhB